MSGMKKSPEEIKKEGQAIANREKLVSLLGKINSAAYIKIPTESGFSMLKCGEEYIADYLISNGVTVKEPQKPLTIKELHDKQGEIVYLEYVKNKLEKLPYVLTCFGTYYAEFDCYDGLNASFIIADYGYTWRCWANRPTEEERKAAVWME